MEAPWSALGISILLIYISLTGVITALILRSAISTFIKIMWVAFIWMLPFIGAFGWLFIQSFDHKFQVDGV